MRIGYGKIGRVVEVSEQKWGQNGGDNEPAVLLLNLAERHPEHTFVVMTRNSGWKPPLPNIENPWQEWMPEVSRMGSKLYGGGGDISYEIFYKTIAFYDALTGPAYEELDGIVMWLGQHGTSNSPIPKIKDRSIYTKPQITMTHYTSHAVRGINRWRRDDPLQREEVWLIADARNYAKGRDLKWPRRHDILGQYNFKREANFERYEDPRTPQECGFVARQGDGIWFAEDAYHASGLEIVGVPPDLKPEMPWEDRCDFGILINEARGYGIRPEMTRLHAMQNYVWPLEPMWVHGNWSKESLAKMGRSITPIPYGDIFAKMQLTKSTFTTPSSGSQWATAKPWECFGTGVICFFHPMYDTQGHIIAKDPNDYEPWDPELAHLARWLRVKDPEDLAKKVKAVDSSRETYEWLAAKQYEIFTQAQQTQRCIGRIEDRLGI